MLINKIIKKYNINRTILIGSYKGRYIALYLGITIKNSIIIAGAPQYKLASYLDLTGNTNVLKYIMGVARVLLRHLGRVMLEGENKFIII